MISVTFDVHPAYVTEIQGIQGDTLSVLLNFLKIKGKESIAQNTL